MLTKVVAFSLLVAAAQARAVRSPPNSDEVVSLPGWEGSLPSRMYSGYLDVSPTKHLHYVFVESENNPSTDPIVLWLNGGPGCSSLDGFIYEHGPFIIDSHDFTILRQRPIRWTQIANVLYLEAPVGVGFSYSDQPEKDYVNTDDTAAHDNLKAVEAFFAKFPDFVKNDFFITGESYAGIYVPTLAEAIMQATDSKNYTGAPLKGIGVGNGCSGNEIGICSNSSQGAYYEWKYLLGTAFISDDLKKTVNNLCNWTEASHGIPLSSLCKSALASANGQIGHINLYNVYGDCVSSMESDERTQIHTKAPHLFEGRLTGPDACIDSRAASAYFNQESVIEAFHVKKPSFTWAVCATPDGWGYTPTRPNLPRDTYPALVRRYRVLIFNGDWDACVPYTDNQAWTQSMGFRAEQPWHAWSYTTADGLEDQVGGYAVKYTVPNASTDSWFRFITVRGGRHEVPESVPDKALEMLKRLLHNGDF